MVWRSGKHAEKIIRVEWAEFRRKLSRETLGKSICMIWGFLEKSLHHRILSKWSPETSAASKLLLGGPWMLPGCFQNMWERPVRVLFGAYSKIRKLRWSKKLTNSWIAYDHMIIWSCDQVQVPSSGTIVQVPSSDTKFRYHSSGTKFRYHSKKYRVRHSFE